MTSALERKIVNVYWFNMMTKKHNNFYIYSILMPCIAVAVFCGLCINELAAYSPAMKETVLQTMESATEVESDKLAFRPETKPGENHIILAENSY
jgi:hypothetical protein